MVTLLVTGSSSDNDRIEIIKSNGDVRTCPQSSNYPLEVSSAAGGYSINARSVTICGGYGVSSRRSDCYTLEDGKWELAGNLVNARSYYDDVYCLKDYYQGMKRQFYAPCFTLSVKIELNDDNVQYFIYEFSCWCC